MLLLAALATIAAATAHSATGIGFTLILAPVLLASLPAATALLTLLVLSTTLCLLMLFGERRVRRIRRSDLAVLLVPALPGLAAGALLLRAVPKPALQIAVGLMVCWAALGTSRPGPGGGFPNSRLAGWATGLASGTLTTSTGLNGPPIALWLAARGAEPEEIRDSLQACFVVLGVLGAPLVGALAARATASPDLLLVGVLLPLVAAGHVLGRRAFGAMADHRYRLGLTVMIVATGVASVVAGLADVL
jgi:uncharacterized membrane protein YfcA